MHPELGVGAESDVAAPIEAVDRLEQRGVALLHEVGGVDAEPAVAIDRGEHEVQRALDVDLAQFLELADHGHEPGGVEAADGRASCSGGEDIAGRLLEQRVDFGLGHAGAHEAVAHDRRQELVAAGHAELLGPIHRRHAPEVVLVHRLADIRHFWQACRLGTLLPVGAVGVEVDRRLRPPEGGRPLGSRRREAIRGHVEHGIEDRNLDLLTGLQPRGGYGSEQFGEHHGGTLRGAFDLSCAADAAIRSD